MYLDDKQLDSGALGRRILADPLVSSSLAGKLATADLPYSFVVPAIVQPTGQSGAPAGLGYQAATIYNFIYITANNQTAWVEWSVFVAAGTYTLRTVYRTGPTSGIATVTIDGGAALGTTIDMYAGGTGYNNISDITGISLTAGRHVIRYTASTKNASSTGFGLGFHGLSVTRTGA